ncbi:MAG: hypothetical protein ABI594_06920 [Ginsengibacter sp.]
MKKIYAISATFFICIMLLSCSKQSINDEVSPDLTNVINVTIAPNQSYHFTVSGPGEVSIVKQAKHYKTSETALEAESGQMIYNYTPAQDYTGTEEIILTNKKAVPVVYGGCNGSHDNNQANTSYSVVYTMLRININN